MDENKNSPRRVLKLLQDGWMMSNNWRRITSLVTYPRYTDVWNGHRESEIHDIHKIGSGTKLYYLWVKGYPIWGERDTQSFYADCFYIVSSQPNQRAAPVAHKVVWPHPGLNLESLVQRQELNSLLFLKIPQILSPRFRCMTSFTPPGLQFYLVFLFWHLWMTHPLRAFVNTCVAPN